ncbi:MAG: DUF488 domain-containing protein [Deltaproteobacteria bacterium]|nr:DUF488 domain-containing protein [Deltaproteobacteria bacterium]
MHLTIWTIGYGGRAPNELVELLTKHGVETVVDVRLRPERAAMGVYVKASNPERGIQRVLSPHGIRYVSLVELGNVFVDLGDEAWREPYRQLLEHAGDLLVRRLETLDGPCALLCAERDPERCHRAELGSWLARHRGVTVEHLR